MKHILSTFALVLLVSAAFAQTADKVKIDMKLPKAAYTGTPKDLGKRKNLEPPRGNKLRDPIFVPTGCGNLLSKGCKVTASDEEPIIGELAYVTDGDKEHREDSYVELGPGKQWIQVDLGAEHPIYAIGLWHYHGEPRVYKSVVIQLSNDPDFIDGVITVFNNDDDNILKLGKGRDKEYRESREGRPVAVDGTKARYVRFWSNGNTSDDMNQYIEVEVYGK